MWPVETMTLAVKGGKVVQADVQADPDGGVPGTLKWLGVALPAPAM